jgi:hypothetical protein
MYEGGLCQWRRAGAGTTSAATHLAQELLRTAPLPMPRNF